MVLFRNNCIPKSGNLSHSLNLLRDKLSSIKSKSQVRKASLKVLKYAAFVISLSLPQQIYLTGHVTSQREDNKRVIILFH